VTLAADEAMAKMPKLVPAEELRWTIRLAAPVELVIVRSLPLIWSVPLVRLMICGPAGGLETMLSAPAALCAWGVASGRLPVPVSLILSTMNVVGVVRSSRASRNSRGRRARLAIWRDRRAFARDDRGAQKFRSRRETS